ncbi:MAG TPA: type II secretion system major pseudopilin GspG [Gammaproteobacteria bacterium]|nr:type II secretion system major pseudopilin GspG [Gammaproteobacteria bacterium]
MVRRTECNRMTGFTLMELLVVLVIIGLLAALVGPTLYHRIKPAKQAAARAQIQNFMTALDNYFVDVGSYPTTQQGLQALRTKPEGVTGWQGPYLKKEVPSDPWEHPYIYRAPGRNGGYEIISYGADGREGGDGENADINSWESKKK